MSLTGRASPGTVLCPLIASGVFFAQSLDLRFRLPLFPGCPIGSQNKEVGGVVVTYLAPRRVGVLNLKGWGLVVELQNLFVMFHLVDGPQFDLVALELDGQPHFSARISAADVIGTPLYATGWGGSAN